MRSYLFVKGVNQMLQELSTEDKVLAQKILKCITNLKKVTEEMGCIPSAYQYQRLSSYRGWLSYTTMTKYLGPISTWPDYLNLAVKTDGVDKAANEAVRETKMVPKRKTRRRTRKHTTEKVADATADATVDATEVEAVEPVAAEVPDEAKVVDNPASDEEPSWRKFLTPGLELEEELWWKIMTRGK